MTVTYGFYNSVNNDRLYDAKQVSRLFEGIINDGVFMSIGTSLMVTSAAGMNVTIGVGRAWFNKTWTDNDTPFNIAVPASHMTLNRIDTVVLEIDTSEAVRANSIKVVSGVPGTDPVRPTLNPPAEVYQYPLADLSIPAGAVTIPQGNITNRVGTVDCPFITGVMATVTTTALLTQWETEFDAWFQAMKDQLTTDAAGNLQTQITNIKGNVNPPAITLLALKTHDHSGGNGNQVVSGGISDLAVIASKIAQKVITAFHIADHVITALQLANPEPWTNLTLLNGWSNGDPGGSWYAPPRIYKDLLGIVHMEGIVQSGPNGTIAFTLPVGYRPAKMQVFNTRADGTYWSNLLIELDGDCKITLGDGNQVANLFGITFKAEA